MVFSAIGVREAEAQRGAEVVRRLNGWSRSLKEFPRRLHAVRRAEVKAVFEELKRTVSPDLIFTHNRKDAHQDHRLISELTWNTFRDHLILEYEIPKYDGDMGQPSVFVPLRTRSQQKKVHHIVDRRSSPSRPSAGSRRAHFSPCMRLRGMECNAPSGYAEAFYCRKLVL